MLPPKDFPAVRVEISPLRASTIWTSSSSKPGFLSSTQTHLPIPSRLFSEDMLRPWSHTGPLNLTTAKGKSIQQKLSQKQLARSRLGSAGEGGCGSPLTRKIEKKSQLCLTQKKITWARKRLIHKQKSTKRLDNTAADEPRDEVVVKRVFSNWRPWQQDEEMRMDEDKKPESESIDGYSVNQQRCTSLNYTNSSSCLRKRITDQFDSHIFLIPVAPVTSSRKFVTSPYQDDVTPLRHSLPLPIDPRTWSRVDVENWLLHMRDAHNIPDLDLNRFRTNGKGLCLLKPEMFINRVPSHGHILHQDFHFRLRRFVLSSAYVPNLL